MAASAANTSREIGAVAGTSVLGALVFSRLNSTLDSHIDALHVSAANRAAIMAFKPLIIKVIETGQIDKYLKAYSGQGGLIAEVEGAAYAAFGDGLHAAFYLSAGLVILAGLLAAFTLGNRPAALDITPSDEACLKQDLQRRRACPASTAPAKEIPLLLRLRCYLPSTSAILLILAVVVIALHSAASHTFAGLSLATEIVIGLGLAGLAAGTIVISAVSIQRRRAAAGACHACSHPCRGAMVPSPEIDARQWPHRPLTRSQLVGCSWCAQHLHRAGSGHHGVARVPREHPSRRDFGVVAVQLDEPRLRVSAGPAGS